MPPPITTARAWLGSGLLIGLLALCAGRRTRGERYYRGARHARPPGDESAPAPCEQPGRLQVAPDETGFGRWLCALRDRAHPTDARTREARGEDVRVAP